MWYHWPTELYCCNAEASIRSGAPLVSCRADNNPVGLALPPVWLRRANLAVVLVDQFDLWLGLRAILDENIGGHFIGRICMAIWTGAVLVSIVIHELGHAIAFRYYGIASDIVLYQFGGLAIPPVRPDWAAGIRSCLSTRL